MGTSIDYTGQTVGNLKVLDQVYVENFKLRWLCKCLICEDEVIRAGWELKIERKIESCGCLAERKKLEKAIAKAEQEKNKKAVGRPRDEVKGKKFGRLTVVRFHGYLKKHSRKSRRPRPSGKGL